MNKYISYARVSEEKQLKENSRTPATIFLEGLIAATAKYESAALSERTKAGIKKARLEGKQVFKKKS